MLEVVGSHFYIKNVFMSCLNYLWLAKICSLNKLSNTTFENSVENRIWKSSKIWHQITEFLVWT